MARLVITGASGYIGKRLVTLARERGHDVVVLGRAAPSTDIVFFPWSLGDAPPLAALTGADAVIHLAHSWAADSVKGAENLNAMASEKLASAALAAGVPRFVFASTNSARATALNAYGRAKFALESRLGALPGAPGRLVSARIGLVYGGVPAGQYAMMRTITRLTPILPMIGLDREIQPIHLDEVCAALLALATDRNLTAPYYVVAGAKPMRFAQWLRLLRRAQTGKGMIFLPMPFRLMLLACDLTRVIPFGPTIDRERVLGLAAASPMDSKDSLAAMNVTVADPQTVLAREEPLPRDTEARALLRYLAGGKTTAGMEEDLQQGLLRAGLAPLGLPPLLLRRPCLIALAEPPANQHANRLAQALYLASQVVEAHGAGPRKREGLFRVGFLTICDLAVLPIRLVAARRYR